jgi:hypothetical protein
LTDGKIYRIAGISSLASIALFFIEFPFYLVRGDFPLGSESAKLPEYVARNATNIMTCVFFDLIILSLILIFIAGLRHLIRRTDPRQEWLATLLFGVGIVYATLTLIADSLQAATAVDALSTPGNPMVIRAMMESMYLMYGAVALWFMALLMAICGFATLTGAPENRGLPKWSGWFSCVCALACLAFVPSMFVRHVDVSGFYNPAGWGPLAVASGFPLAAWMIVLGILMARKRDVAEASPDSSL